MFVGGWSMQKTNPATSSSSLFQRLRLSKPSITDWWSTTIIKRWLTPPQFADPEENRRARTLYTFILIASIVSNLIAITLLFNIPDRRMTITIILVLNIVVVAAIALIRNKQLLLGGSLYLLALWVLATYTVFFLHGEISNPTLGAYLLMILGAGVFIGLRMAIAVTGLVWASLVGFMIADFSGWIPEPRFPLSYQQNLLLQSLIFALGLVIIFVAIQSMQKAIKRSHAHERDLRDNNRKLQEVMTSLEERISQRTSEITRQKQFFEALVLNSPIAIVTLDNEHHILSCNPAFEQLFGYTQEEVIGRDLDHLITTPATNAEAISLTARF